MVFARSALRAPCTKYALSVHQVCRLCVPRSAGSAHHVCRLCALCVQAPCTSCISSVHQVCRLCAPRVQAPCTACINSVHHVCRLHALRSVVLDGESKQKNGEGTRTCILS
eukprot:637869-Pelagomonas_calceolata.AAC.3